MKGDLPSRSPFAAILSVAAALACALVLGSCGDTLQDQPIGADPFEDVIVNSRVPVYWVGLRFQGLPATNVREDPGGAVTVDYGDCVIGGQYTCVTPLQIVTSPDNSFIPGAPVKRSISVRGLPAVTTPGGSTISLATGPVVVSIYARNAALASAAARAMAPLNQPGSSGAPLPAAIADTGYGRVPLHSQVPQGQSVPRLR